MDEVRSRLDDVQKAAKDFASAAGDQFKPQTSAFQQSLSKVRSDVQQLASGDRAAALGALSNDVPAVQTAWNELTDAVGSTCK
jgi:hypothetical protein